MTDTTNDNERHAPNDSPGQSGNRGFRGARGVVVLAIIVFAASEAAINALGWATPVAHLVAAGLATATVIATQLAKFRKELVGVPWWAYVVALIALIAILGIAKLTQKPETSKTYSGLLTAHRRSAQIPVTAGTGDEYVLTLDSSDGLNARLQLTHGEYIFDGTAASHGRSRIDQTLSAGTWTATVAANGDSVGHYDLTVAHDPATAIAVGDVVSSDLTDPADSNGYELQVPKRELVYIGVQPIDSGLALQVQLLKATGFIAANPRAKGSGWEYFRSFDPGKYLIVVRSATGAQGSYELSVRNHAPQSTATQATAPATGLLTVPHVVKTSQGHAEATLSAIGFAPRSFLVCSSSVPAGVVRQVVRVVDGHEVVVDDKAGVTSDQTKLPAGTKLIVKVGNGSPCP